MPFNNSDMAVPSPPFEGNEGGIYGLIGFPLSHSFSKSYFSEKFIRESIPAEYVNFEIEAIEKIEEIVLTHPNLKGLNVTIPYKEKVIPLLETLSDEADTIQAVNVVKIERTNAHPKLTGFNTDYIGFRDSLQPLLDKTTHRKALILGTGGASKAVAFALHQLDMEATFVSRTAHENHLSYPDLNASVMQEHTVIINTTPLGTYPHTETCPDIPYLLLTPHHIAYDLVYNPSETLFLQKAKKKGAIIKNGLEMLQLQAEAAWKIWNA